MEFSELFNELKNFCDEENIVIVGYNNPNDECYTIRFDKKNKVIRYKLSYFELKYKSHYLIIKEIQRHLRKLYDELTTH